MKYKLKDFVPLLELFKKGVEGHPYGLLPTTKSITSRRKTREGFG